MVLMHIGGLRKIRHNHELPIQIPMPRPQAGLHTLHPQGQALHVALTAPTAGCLIQGQAAAAHPLHTADQAADQAVNLTADRAAAHLLHTADRAAVPRRPIAGLVHQAAHTAVVHRALRTAIAEEAAAVLLIHPAEDVDNNLLVTSLYLNSEFTS
jgi:hypothetical protein